MSMKLQIRNAFNRASGSYEQSALVQKNVAGICADLVVPGRYPVVLEIGAGAGFLVADLLPRIQVGRYVAVDIAEGMVRKKIFRSHPALEPVVGDGERMPVCPGGVDLLVSSSAMQWYLAPEVSVPRNLELLRKGGRFVVALFVSGTLCELACVSKDTGFGSLFPLKSVEFYAQIMENIPGISFQLHSRSQVVWHDSPAAFLRAHKETGARYSSGKGKVGRRVYMDFCRHYEQRYGCKGQVPASYEILFIEGYRI